MSSYPTTRYGDIDVCWPPELEGGGASFGQDYIPVVEQLFGRVGRVFELCAGPGCIGFSLLAHGLCDTLVLSDINPLAVEVARETVRRNGLEDRVTVHQSDGLSDIPAEERCDLFVANPPFFPEERVPFLRDSAASPELRLRAMDPGLQLHKSLYRDMARYLSPGGSTLMQGCSLACTPETFAPMIDASGLQHVRTMWYTKADFPFIYYVWTKQASFNLTAAGPPDTSTSTVDVELRDAPQSPMVLPTRKVHTPRLHNLTDRAVSLVMDVKGNPGSRPNRYNSLAEIPPGGKLELMQMVVHPERLVSFREESSGSVLASLHGSH